MRAVACWVAVLALLGSSPSQGGELSAVQIKTARKLYISKCAKCHKLYDPDDCSSGKWDEWMGRMAAKSKLKPEQAELLARYIEAGKAGQVELPKSKR